MSIKPLLLVAMIISRGVMAASLVGVVAGCQPPPDSGEEEPDKVYLERLRSSPNYAGGRFANELATNQVELSEVWSAMADQLAPRADRRPSYPLPSEPYEPSQLDSAGNWRAVWLGHSTVLIEIDGVRIMTDPVFDASVKHVVGSTSRFRPSPCPRDSLPPIDIVLISHDHFDHLERSSVEHLAPNGTVFFAPLGVGRLLRSWGVPEGQVVELDWWENITFGPIEVHCTPARHFSGRSLSEINKSLWCSWVVLGSQSRLFYAGDTGYSDHFARIGAMFGPFDLTLMPIGAYDDAWPDIHIGPEEAVVAHQDLRGRVLLPVHWGTFDLAAHAWNDPITRLIEAAVSENTNLVTPRLGEVIGPDRSSATDRWWEGAEPL